MGPNWSLYGSCRDTGVSLAGSVEHGSNYAARPGGVNLNPPPNAPPPGSGFGSSMTAPGSSTPSAVSRPMC